MTNNDKTGDQLVESMRRTKAGVSKKTAVTKKAAATKKTSAVKKKANVAQKEQPSPRNALQEREQVAVQTDSGTDTYQARRRVWPD